MPIRVVSLTALLWRLRRAPAVQFVRAAPLGVFLLSFFCAPLITAQNSTQPVVRVAVASNFADTARILASQFEQIQAAQNQDVSVQLRIGSTGKITSQIEFGLAVDVFLAADQQRPQILIDKGLAKAKYDYALGRLVLWHRGGDDLSALAALTQKQSKPHKPPVLAMANPRLAPYGRAAQEVLDHLGLSQQSTNHIKLVRGESVSQSLQYVLSASAEFGFIAYSQYLALKQKQPVPGEIWMVPPELYAPIVQSAVLVNESPLAQAFFDFLKGDEASAVIIQSGYFLPERV